MKNSKNRLQVLHLHSTFDAGGKELRSVRLMNAFGQGVDHTVVSAEDGAMGAARLIDRSIRVAYPRDFPTLTGWPTLGRLQRLARAMKRYDLVLTYNWGAMDAVMAHTLFARAFGLPPLVHHEDGFNDDEAKKLKSSRNWFRRIALGCASALIVPSRRLEQVALDNWQQPPGRIKRISNGIPTRAYGGNVRPDAVRGVIKRKGEFWVGTLAGLRAVKNLPRLVRACTSLPDNWQLVIFGEGPERDAIRAEAMRLEVGHRVHLPGFVAKPESVMGLLDIFALSSDSEQFPLSVVEAMAAGLPVVAPMVGDVADIVAEPNQPFIVPAGDETALACAIAELAGDGAMRKSVGEANRARARAEFDEATMVAAYRAIYAQAMGRERFP